MTLVLAVLICLWYFMSDDGQPEDWDMFKVQHDCKIVGHVARSTSITTAGDVVFNSAKTQWLCNDGVTYTR